MSHTASGNGTSPHGDDFISEQEINDYISKFEKLQNEFGDLEKETREPVNKWLRGLAGSRLEALLQNPDETMNSLSDPDPEIRQAAVYIAVDHWNLVDTAAKECERLAVNDPDSEVRRTALGALGTCYYGTKDQRIGRILATTILSDGEPVVNRTRAYSSLLSLHGYADCPTSWSLFSIQFPNDIDWGFVYLYYDGRVNNEQ